MNLFLPKESAEIIKVVFGPQIDKAMKAANIEQAKVLQTIVTTVETTVQTGAKIEFK